MIEDLAPRTSDDPRIEATEPAPWSGLNDGDIDVSDPPWMAPETGADQPESEIRYLETPEPFEYLGPVPAVETCNDVDDDLDGQIDEGALNTCGGCGDTPAEVCDGIDNDCDGVVDPGCDCQNDDVRPCGPDVGACIAGEQVCELGRWAACEGAQGPSAEQCNLEDDDCDGEVDEEGACPCATASTDDALYLLCGTVGPREPLQFDQRTSWGQALALCDAVGFELTSISSATEDRFIFDNMVEQGFDSTWIGLTDRQTEGDFEWADGAQLDYENWDRGEPNNNSGDGGEDCASILTDRGRASFWDDRPCNRAYSFVCERALP